MSQPKTVTVTLSDFSTVEVRMVSKRERAELYHRALQRRIQMTDGVEALSARQALIEDSEFVRGVIALATGKSGEWANRLSRDDQQSVLQALVELHEEWAEKLRATLRELDQNHKPSTDN